MRSTRIVAAAAILAVLALSAQAQTGSALNFPRSLTNADLASTGFALVNLGSSSAALTVRMYDRNGQLMSSTSQDVPAGGQIAFLGSEALTATGSAAGWVRITSATSGIRGISLGGDFATFVDGAAPAVETIEQVFPLVTDQTEISVANPGSAPAQVTLSLFGADGQSLGSAVVTIPGLGAYQNPASMIFPGVDLSTAGALRVLSATPVAASSLVRGFLVNQETAVINAVAVSGARRTIFFPYAPTGAAGGSLWTTVVGAANLSTSAQDVSLTFTPDSGDPITVQRTIPPSGAFREAVGTLFNLPPDQFRAGWVRVTGSAALAGFAAYADTASGSLAVVPVQNDPQSRFYFGHIADLAPWFSGVALLNPGTTTANVELYAVDSNGGLIGSISRFNLDSGKRVANLLSELVPQTKQRSSDGGFVFVRTTNNVPLYGIELFGHAVNPILANVEAFPLDPSSTYAPPTGPRGALSLDRLLTADAANVAKTIYRPGDALRYLIEATNNTSQSVRGDLRVRVTGPNQALVTDFASQVDISAGKNTYRPTGSVASNALNGDYQVTATLTSGATVLTTTATYAVTGGFSIPNVVVERVFTTDLNNQAKFSFQPGDTVRYVIVRSSTQTQAVQGSHRYEVNAFNSNLFDETVSGVSIGSGLITTFIDRQIPAGTRTGVYTFTGSVTVQNQTSSRSTSLSIGPATAGVVTVDRVFTLDRNGIPQTVFRTGDSVRFLVYTFSSFSTPVPVTVRYRVVSSAGQTILDFPNTFNLGSGPALYGVTVTIPPGAANGTHTFTSTLTVQGETSPSSKSVDITIGTGTVPTPFVAIDRAYTTDAAGNFRSTFLRGEDVVFGASLFSSYSSSYAVSLSFRITNSGNQIFAQTFTFPIPISGGAARIGLRFNNSVPLGPYTFTATLFDGGRQIGQQTFDFNLVSTLP